VGLLFLVLSLWSVSVSAQNAAHKPEPTVKRETLPVHRIVIQLSTADTLEHKLMGKGIQFVAYRNTMKQKGITDEQILSNVGFVDMGTGEIVLYGDINDPQLVVFMGGNQFMVVDELIAAF
jgi:hypothetical protein